MSLFKLDKSNFCVAQSTFKRRFGNWRGPRKRFFLLETDGNWSDRRQLMGFISWPLVYERGKVYWNQGSNSAQLLFIDPKFRKTSRQNQILHSKNKIALVLPWVFAFAVRYLAFAMRYLVLL